jgi:hypothetical protein
MPEPSLEHAARLTARAATAVMARPRRVKVGVCCNEGLPPGGLGWADRPSRLGIEKRSSVHGGRSLQLVACRRVGTGSRDGDPGGDCTSLKQSGQALLPQ